MRDSHSYDVAVVPFWDRSATIVEHVSGALPAIELHASIARELRSRGWAVIDHSIPHYVAA